MPLDLSEEEHLYIKALEQELQEQRLWVKFYQTVISQASKELGIDILKKKWRSSVKALNEIDLVSLKLGSELLEYSEQAFHKAERHKAVTQVRQRQLEDGSAIATPSKNIAQCAFSCWAIG